MDIRRGIGEGGGDLKGRESAGFPRPIFFPFFTAFFFAHLLWEINTFQRMSSIPLTGEQAPHSVCAVLVRLICVRYSSFQDFVDK